MTIRKHHHSDSFDPLFTDSDQQAIGILSVCESESGRDKLLEKIMCSTDPKDVCVFAGFSSQHGRERLKTILERRNPETTVRLEARRWNFWSEQDAGSDFLLDILVGCFFSHPEDESSLSRILAINIMNTLIKPAVKNFLETGRFDKYAFEHALEAKFNEVKKTPRVGNGCMEVRKQTVQSIFSLFLENLAHREEKWESIIEYLAEISKEINPVSIGSIVSRGSSVRTLVLDSVSVDEYSSNPVSAAALRMVLNTAANTGRLEREGRILVFLDRPESMPYQNNIVTLLASGIFKSTGLVLCVQNFDMFSERCLEGGGGHDILKTITNNLIKIFVATEKGSLQNLKSVLSVLGEGDDVQDEVLFLFALSMHDSRFALSEPTKNIMERKLFTDAVKNRNLEKALSIAMTHESSFSLDRKKLLDNIASANTENDVFLSFFQEKNCWCEKRFVVDGVNELVNAGMEESAIRFFTKRIGSENLSKMVDENIGGAREFAFWLTAYVASRQESPDSEEKSPVL